MVFLICATIKITVVSYIIGEGDAFGNLNLTTNGGIHKSAVMLRCSCCVDTHILDANDLKEVLQIFPEFRKNLKQKMSTVMKKTVLTSQVRHVFRVRVSFSLCNTEDYIFTTELHVTVILQRRFQGNILFAA